MLTIRALAPDEAKLAVTLARAEGWNPGLEDMGAFFATDPDGFLVGELDGQAVSLISAIRYTAEYGFVGFYICAPEFRGQGHGWAVWQAAMEQLGERTVGLDGVVDQQENYRKSGFVLAHRNIRHGGRLNFSAPDDPRLTPITEALISSVVAYDRDFVPAAREAFLSAWLDPAARTRHSLALVADGQVEGYGTIRQCGEGWKVGPLFANTPSHADTLFQALCAKVGPEQIFLDTPEPNAEALALARRHGMTAVFETARMYRGQDPKLPLARIFGITTFELG